jgi:DNA polymerase III subunit epsilon
MNTYAVIDFKTTGPSTEKGDRPIEVAVVRVERGQVMDRYHSFMNAQVPIPEAIQSLTGLSEARIRQAPSANKVMKAVAKFIGNMPLVAHNWGFHGRFLAAEWQRIGHPPPPTGVCSLLLSRRL